MLVSEDCVALDAVAQHWIETARKQKGMKSLKEAKREPVWLKTASSKGLGQYRLKHVKVVKR